MAAVIDEAVTSASDQLEQINMVTHYTPPENTLFFVDFYNKGWSQVMPKQGCE